MNDTASPPSETPAEVPPAVTVEDYRNAIAKYNAATAAYHSATRFSLEQERRRIGSGLKITWDVVNAADRDDFVGNLESEMYDGARAIVEFTTALERNGGGTCAQLDKLCQAAADLALYALNISHVKHSDELAVNKVITAARVAEREVKEKARVAAKIAVAGLARKAQRDERSAAARKELEDERAALRARLDPHSPTFEVDLTGREIVKNNLLPGVEKRLRALDEADELSRARDWTTEPV